MRIRGYFLMIVLAVSAAACLCGVLEARQEAPKLSVPIMKTSEIKPGMKGYGLTVFKGTKPERFDVEVVDVLRKAFPKHDMILIKCSHPIIDKAHVISGMSGSPIYINDRLIGALAYGWGFTKESLAGVTPIEWMLEEMKEPPKRKTEGTGERIAYRTGGPGEESDELDAGMPQGLARLRVPVYLSGLAGLPAKVTRALRREFDKRGLLLLQGTSGTDATQDIGVDALVPGAPVGFSLMRGDFSLTGIGTLTHREGNRMIAFGHPMLLSGREVAMPVTTAYVHGIMPSQRTSFKFSSPSRSVGTVTQDSMSGVAATLKRDCPMIPVTVEVHNVTTGDTDTLKVEIIDNRSWSPHLLRLASTYLLQLEAASDTSYPVDYSLDMEFEKHGKLHLEGLDIALGGASISEPASALGILLNNPFEPMHPKRVTLKLKAEHKRIDARIQRAWLEQLEVRPGKEVNLHIRVHPYESAAKEITFPVRIPEHLDEGKYEIVVGGGASLAVQQPTPPAESVNDIFTQLKMRYRPTTVVAVLKLPTVGVGFKGRLFRQLPSSVFGTLVSSSSAGVSTFQDGIRFTHETKWYLTGGAQNLKIIVKQSAEE